MSPLIYTFNITTLALWLSAVVLDGVGWLLPVRHPEPKSSRAGETTAIIPPPEISLGPPAAAAAPADPGVPAQESATADPPPALPDLPDLPPLPEIPDISPKPPAPDRLDLPHDPKPKPPRRAPAGNRPTDNNGGPAPASAADAAARMGAGQMQSPVYPPEAQRKGQTGTVLVEFVVGTDGRVISAYPKIPSPWPLLNNEAVRTVREWKFPPGTLMKLQRPIVFQLK